MFFQVTAVPGRIASVAGLKPKLPSLLFTINTVCERPGRGVAFTVGVGVATVGVVVTTGVVAAGVGVAAAALPAPPALPPAAPPQAASSIIKPRAATSRPNQVNLNLPRLGWQVLPGI